MKKLRTLLLSALLALDATAMADDYQYLTVTQQAGGDTSFAVSNIQKITFDASNMVLHLGDGTTQSLALSDLSKMFFSDGHTGIATRQAQSKMQFSDGMLRATVAEGELIAIYNMKGEQVFSTNRSGNFDLTTLTKGVYIVKVGNETRKVINK